VKRMTAAVAVTLTLATICAVALAWNGTSQTVSYTPAQIYLLARAQPEGWATRVLNVEGNVQEIYYYPGAPQATSPPVDVIIMTPNASCTIAAPAECFRNQSATSGTIHILLGGPGRSILLRYAPQHATHSLSSTLRAALRHVPLLDGLFPAPPIATSLHVRYHLRFLRNPTMLCRHTTCDDAVILPGP